MSVIVTGAAGYIGSNAVVQLMEQGFKVIAIDKRPIQWGIPKKYEHKVKKYQVDIATDELAKVFRANKGIKGVLHFAGEISVSQSVITPQLHYDNNLIASYNLIKQMSIFDVNNLIFSSSAAVYGEPKFTKSKKTVNEDDPLCPINPYGTTKMMVEMILEDLQVANPMFNYCSLRYFNVVGNDPQQRIKDYNWKEKTNLFPALMRAFLGYTPDIRVYGTDYSTPDGTAVRDYIHVTDLVNAHVLALSKLYDQEPIDTVYNVGSGVGHSVKEVVNAFEQNIGFVPAVKASRREGDPERLVACPKAIMKDLGWKPRHTSLDKMIVDYANMICRWVPVSDGDVINGKSHNIVEK